MSRTKLFFIENLNTYPKNLIGLFNQYDEVLKRYFDGKTAHSAHDIHCLLEVNEFWNNSKLKRLETEALDLLWDYSFRAYHNTRLLDLTSVMDYGLVPLAPETYLQSMHAVLLNSPCRADVELLMTKLQPYMDNQRGNRTEHIAFFAPYYLAQDFSKFCVNVGGEVAEFAFYDQPALLHYLSIIGSPVTVEFAIPIAHIASYRMDVVIAELVRKYCCEVFLNQSYKIGFDAATRHRVPAEDIFRLSHSQVNPTKQRI